VRHARLDARLIYASEHPYYAVTKKDGTFSIPDVPRARTRWLPGKEYTTRTEVPVTVKAKKRRSRPSS